MHKKILIGGLSVVILGIVGTGIFFYYNKNNDVVTPQPTAQKTTPPVPSQKQQNYRLNLTKTVSYKANESVGLLFDIRDEDDKLLKSFDKNPTEPVHLIVVRKDRTNFQHLHPTFDKSSSRFNLANLTLPTDGEYRVFADFTAADALTGDTGEKLSSSPFVDIKVGSGSYTSELLGAEKLTSDVNGFSTKLAPLVGDSASVITTVMAGQPKMLTINIDKNGVPFKDLQLIDNSLGHMIGLGPNLEFTHTDAMFDASILQTGLISFVETFPQPGQYKIYVETQADGRVNITDYTMAVELDPIKKPS